MVPVGVGTTPPDDRVLHYQNNTSSPTDLFREIRSAPARLDSSRTDLLNSAKKPHKRAWSTRKSLNWRKLFQFFIGHAPGFTQWAAAYHGSCTIYAMLFFIESSFRSIGNVTFCNNPLSGLIIFTAMLLSSPQTTFLAYITLTFGILTAVVFLQIPLEEARGGAVTFNCYLTGTVIASLAADNVILVHPEIILICMLMGCLTVIIWKGLNGLLASKLEFPLLNAPFHVILLLYLLSGLAAKYKPEEVYQIKSINDSPIQLNNFSVHGGIDTSGDRNHNTGELNVKKMFSNSTNSHKIKSEVTPSPILLKQSDELLVWERIPSGVILAPSQVFGTKGIWTSLMIWTAILLYSPLILVQAITGSIVGGLVGIFLSSPEDYVSVYNGSWSYNSLFTSSALTLFLVFNVRSWLLALCGSIITALLYASMVKCNVPVLGIPFMLISWLLLPSIPSMSWLDNSKGESDKNDPEDKCSESEPFLRLRFSEITTPELHWHQWHVLQLESKANNHNDKYKSQVFATSQQPESSNIVLPL